MATNFEKCQTSGLEPPMERMTNASEVAVVRLREQTEKEQNFERLLELACRFQRSIETHPREIPPKR
jgi:hypothetical protein